MTQRDIASQSCQVVSVSQLLAASHFTLIHESIVPRDKNYQPMSRDVQPGVGLRL